MIFADFKDLCIKQLEHKGLISKKYKDRLHHEMVVLENQATDYKTNLYSYFTDLSESCKKSGSRLKNTNNLLVSYLLDITDEDPVKLEIDMIKTKSAEYPDIDTDFEDAQRDQVKEYLIQKYGQEHVASICTLHQMHPRTVIKDICRVKAVPFEEVNEITKLIPDTFTVGDKDIDATIDLCIEKIPQVKTFIDKYSYINLYTLCTKLEGNIRHLGMHAAGVVVSPKDKPLDTICGLEKTKDVVVTCWQEGSGSDGHELSKVGLIKFDILGLNTLTVIKNALQMIKENHGVDIDMDNLDLTDEKVLKEFYRSNTIGVFQFEREWIRSLLRKIKITSFEDIAAVNALNRPGPLDAGMDEKFWKIKNGFEKQSYLHPSLEPILKNTYCIILYQEQVMEIAQKLAGFSADEADNFRSALSKGKANLAKGINDFEKHEKVFISRCMQNGIKGKIRARKTIHDDREIPITAENVKVESARTDKEGNQFKIITCDVEISDELFSQIKTFARYGFNKSHSVEYGFLAFQCMYLKHYYPKEYAASLLTNTPNKLDPKTNENKFIDYFYEAKRMGVDVLPPDINSSFLDFKVIDGKIRSGFGFIKGLGDRAVSEIVTKRPFKSFRDFMQKVDGRSVNKSAVLALIHSGSFDSLLDIKDRKDLPKRYDLMREYLTYKKDKKTMVPFDATVMMAITAESEVIGGEIFNNILHLVDNSVNEQFQVDDRIVKFSMIDSINAGTTVRICGIVHSFFISDKGGRTFGFLELRNSNKKVKLMLWQSEINKIRNDEDLRLMFQKGNVLAVRVERQRDYKNGKTFVLQVDGAKKVL